MRQTILILQFGDLGDTILTVPAIRAIRSRYADARLVLLGKRTASEYLLALRVVDAAIDVDKHTYDRPLSALKPSGVISLLRLAGEIRRLRADTVVIFHHLVTRWGTWKFAALALASGARRRVGIDNGRGWFLTHAVADRGFGFRHEAQYWLDVAGLVDAPGVLQLDAPVTEADRWAAGELLSGAGGSRLIAIHPGTGWYGPGRRWPAERFGRAAEIIRAAADIQCVVVGTADDRDAARSFVDRLDGAVQDLVGKTSVGVLGAVLERCEVVLANDGGVAHLAAAVGTPVVAVFGPSNEHAWRPLSGTVVACDLPCRPCFYRDFDRGLPNGCATRECLALVTPEMVARAALAAMEDRPIAV
jgi:heptosyltransferase-2